MTKTATILVLSLLIAAGAQAQMESAVVQRLNEWTEQSPDTKRLQEKAEGGDMQAAVDMLNLMEAYLQEEILKLIRRLGPVTRNHSLSWASPTSIPSVSSYLPKPISKRYRPSSVLV